MSNQPRPAGQANAATNSRALAAAADQAELTRGRLMRQSLAALLDRVPGARGALPHLAALEVSLARQGTAVIASISRVQLAKICSQLSSLPLPAEDRPLQMLLGRLMDALEALQPQPIYPSDFLTDSRLMVAEASFTDFAKAADDFPGTSPSTRPGAL